MDAITNLPLALTRLNVTRAEVGILRVVAGAKVTVYETMDDGSSPVDEDGTVQDGATKSILYSDRGAVVTVANPVTADDQGLVQFYIPRGEVHILVVALDGSRYGIPWMAVGGFPAIRGITGDTYVTDYVSVRAAMDATPHGGILWFPKFAGPYIPPDANGWRISKPISLCGGSRDKREDVGIKPFNPGGTNGWKNSCCFYFDFNDPGTTDHPDIVTIRGFIFSGYVWANSGIGTDGSWLPTDGTGDAIRFIPYAHGHVISQIRIEECNFNYFGRSAVRLDGGAFDGSGYTVEVLIKNCSTYECAGDCYFITNSTVCTMMHCGAYRANGMGFYFYNCPGLKMIGCWAEHCFVQAGKYANNTVHGGGMTFELVHGAQVVGCHYEDYDRGAGLVKNGLVLLFAQGVVVGGCTFGNNSLTTTANSRGIWIEGGSWNNTILSNDFSQVDTAVEVQPGCPGNVVMPQSILNSALPNARGRMILNDTQSFYFTQNTDGNDFTMKDGVGLQFPQCTVASLGVSAKRKRMMFFDDTAHQFAYYDDAGTLRHITGVT